MDRRREPRFDCNQQGRLVILDTDESLEVTIVNLSGRGMQLRLKRSIPISTAVRIDYADNLLLGDICYCRVEGDDTTCGVRLSHSLLGPATLANLSRQLDRRSTQRVSVP